MIFDSHAHYDDEAFDQDREQVLKEVKESNVAYIVNASANIESSKKAVDLSNKYDFIYAAVGIHPQDAEKFKEDAIDTLKELSKNKKVVAIGEIGLDYYYEGAEKEVQKRVFREQVELAVKLNLPVIIHDREAHSDTFEIVKDYQKKGLRGVLHCYSGSLDFAKEYVNMGFYIGFTGVITFKNAKKSIEVLKGIPIDSILIETDCPYLAPVPMRGKRNDSRYLKYTIGKACDVLNIEQYKFEDITCKNAMKLFNII